MDVTLIESPLRRHDLSHPHDESAKSDECSETSEMTVPTARASDGFSVERATLLLIAESVGSGVLALPGQAAHVGVGWFSAFFLLTVVANLFAGRLLLLVVDEDECLRRPAGDVVDLADSVCPRARPYVRAIWYGNLVFTLSQYIVVMSNSLHLAGIRVNFILLSLLAAIVVLSSSQLSTLISITRHGLVHLSLVATGIILALCIVKGKSPRREQARGSAYVLDLGTALSAISFAFGSQRLLLNVRREMAHAAKASCALYIAIPAFSTIYIIVVALSGPSPADFLLDDLERYRQLTGGLLFSHIAVSYTLNLQALATTITRSTGKLSWSGVTTVATACCWLLANLVPQFATLASLTGALTSAPLNLAVPAFLYWYQLRVNRLRASEGRLFGSLGPCLLLALSGAILIAGTSSAAINVAQLWRQRSK